MKLHPVGIRAVFAIVGLTVLAVAEGAVAQITVTSLADSGPGTLRTAISQATSGSGNVTILFDPSLAGGTIHVLSSLGNLNKDGITIQGDINGDEVPDIELEGSSAPTNTNGLTIQSANCVVSGLVVNRFGANGIRITGANATNNTIRNCFVGTNPAGAAALPNLAGGILINSGASNNVIGPSNVISGNSGNSADGIQINAASGNTVKGNRIGTDLAGVTAIPNQVFGINITGGSSVNVIGGVSASDRNVVSGNVSAGIRVNGASTSANSIVGNHCGVDIAGLNAVPNNNGILLNSGTNLNIIGPGNVLAGNTLDGIQLSNANNNTIKGNWVGTDFTGTVAVPNQRHGINLAANASGNTIGGSVASDCNVVSGNQSTGIQISGSGSITNSVIGNLCGTNQSGTAALPNLAQGILVTSGASQNAIGPGNVISGNGDNGIRLTGSTASSNSVFENRVGTNQTGTAAIPNGGQGILVDFGASQNVIGPDNLCSGNQGSGIRVSGTGTLSNSVSGNVCGVNQSGTSAIPNGGPGILVDFAASQNMIGPNNVLSGNQESGLRLSGAGTSQNQVTGNLCGTNQAGDGAMPNAGSGILIDFSAAQNTIGPGNVISGNVGRGINVNGSSGNVIRGNRVGTNALGQSALGNTQAGIILQGGATGNQIGGPQPTDVNVISGNLANGVTIQGSVTTGNVVLGNLIGSSADGMLAVGNNTNGILLQSGANQNTIGPANAIRSNGGDGVHIQDSTTAQNKVTRNAIWTNSSEGIALALGSQENISSPIINGVTATSVSGTAASSDGAIVEIFSDLEDEGQTYLGSATLNSGQFVFGGSIPLNRRVTATVTDTNNNSSGFSTPFVVGDNFPSQAPPCEGDFLIASRKYGSVYAVNGTTGLIRGLVSGLELRNSSGAVRGSGPVVGPTTGAPVTYDIRLLCDPAGTILARFGSGSASFGMISIDRATGNRMQLPSTNQTMWDEAGDLFYLDANTIISSADHWNTGTTGAILRHDLLTSTTTIVSGPTVGDGPLPLLPRPVAQLDSSTLVVAELGLTNVTSPSAYPDVGVYLVDLPTGNRTFLSRLTYYKLGFTRTVIVNGSPAGTVTIGDDEGGQGPVMNTQCRSVVVVNGRIFVSESVFLGGDSFLGGILEIDRQTGDRSLVVGHAFADDGMQSQVVEVLPTGASSVNLDAPISLQNDGSGNLLFTHLFGTNGLYPIHRYNLISGVLEQLAEISSQVLPEYSDLQLSGLAVYHGPSLNINEQPTDLTICAGSDAHLSIVACGNPSPAFQWRFNDVPLSDNGHVQGATTQALTILSSTLSDAGPYDCLISNGSGEITSIDAALTVLTGGTGDGNGDSRADGLDIQGFTNALLVGGPPSPGYCAYDMNGDGTVSMADVNPFVQLLLAS